MLELLLKLGFSEKESKVYMASLSLGSAPATEIAQKAGINRPITYVIAEKLTKLGLMSSYDKGKIRYFSPENPDQLKRMIEAEEQLAHLKLIQLDSVLPELKALFGSGAKSKVAFYEGEVGRLAFRRQLDSELPDNTPNFDYYAFLDIDQLEALFPEFESWNERRVECQSNLHLLYTRQAGAKSGFNNKAELSVAEYLTKEKFPIEGLFIIREDGRIYSAELNSNSKDFNSLMINSSGLSKNLILIWKLAFEAAHRRNTDNQM